MQTKTKTSKLAAEVRQLTSSTGKCGKPFKVDILFLLAAKTFDNKAKLQSLKRKGCLPLNQPLEL